MEKRAKKKEERNLRKLQQKDLQVVEKMEKDKIQNSLIEKRQTKEKQLKHQEEENRLKELKMKEQIEKALEDSFLENQNQEQKQNIPNHRLIYTNSFDSSSSSSSHSSPSTPVSIGGDPSSLLSTSTSSMPVSSLILSEGSQPSPNQTCQQTASKASLKEVSLPPCTNATTHRHVRLGRKETSKKDSSCDRPQYCDSKISVQIVDNPHTRVTKPAPNHCIPKNGLPLFAPTLSATGLPPKNVHLNPKKKPRPGPTEKPARASQAMKAGMPLDLVAPVCPKSAAEAVSQTGSKEYDECRSFAEKDQRSASLREDFSSPDFLQQYGEYSFFSHRTLFEDVLYPSSAPSFHGVRPADVSPPSSSSSFSCTIFREPENPHPIPTLSSSSLNPPASVSASSLS
eukprot:Sdes_comp19604_c0_seq1m11340